MLVSGTISVAANDSSANVLAGNEFEFLRRNSNIRVRATAASADLFMRFALNNVDIAQDALIPPTARFPIVPDDHLVSVVGPAGARLILVFTNKTAGAIVAQYAVDIM